MRARLAIALIAAAAVYACGDGAPPPPTEPFQAEVRFARADGTRIAWYERGEGPPLVMLRG